MKFQLITLLVVIAFAGIAFADDDITPTSPTAEPQTYIETLQWGVDQNSAYPAVMLGLEYESGANVKRDYQRAYELFVKAYKLGDANGAFHAARMNGNGELALVDHPEACDWYEKAIALEPRHAPAYNNLAGCYDLGKGRKKDVRKAVHYYELAVKNETDSGISLCNLANIYATGGGGIKKNRAKAKVMIKQGIAKGVDQRTQDLCQAVWRDNKLGQ